jgi:Cu/Ag efflux pump CusA
MVFEPGTDIFKARQVVAERLTQAHALPQVSKPPRMLQPLSSTDRVLLVGMSSKTVPALQMGVLARWTIAPRLVGVPGVANVSVWGQQDRQLQVQVDPARLRAKGVSLSQVVESSANALWVSPLTFVEASTPGTGGFIDTANQRLGVQHESPIRTAADLGKIRLEGSSKKLVLGDVASVVEDHQPLIGHAVVGDEPGLLLVIQRFPGSNLLDVTRGVEKALREMQPGLNGITFDTRIYRPATYVEKSIDGVKVAAYVAFALLALVLGGFLFRWRTALVALVVVPLAAVLAPLVLWAAGATINAIVVAALATALLLVIDDAVVGAEHVARRLRERPGEPRTETVLEATLEVRRPLLYATLIVGLAAVPLFFFERLSGAFFPDLAAAYLVALAASLAVGLTVTPALCALFFARGRSPGEGPRHVAVLERRYDAVLTRVAGRPKIVYLVSGTALALALVATPFFGQSLLPTLKESNLLIRWDGPPGTSLAEMNRITALASRELRSLPGVREVGAHVGRAVTGDQVVGANSGELWVGLDPSAPYDRTAASVTRVIEGYPGLSHNVETYSQNRVRKALTGARDDLVVRVYGEDLPTLATQAAKVRQVMTGVDGVMSPHVLLPAEEPTLQIRVDLARADRYGLKPGDVRRTATTLLSGLVVGSLFEQQKVFDVVVWGTSQTRNSLTSVQRLLIDTPDGGQVRLGDVADVRIAAAPGVIRRQAVSRYVDVGANVSGRGRDAVVRDVQNKLQLVRFPLEYHAEVLEETRQPIALILGIAAAAIVGIFLLLQALFGSWRLATLATLSLPLAAVGGVAAALVTGASLSFGSYLALLAILGLAARSAVLLFERYRRLARDAADPFDIVRCGARERLAPVTVSTLAIGLVSIAVLALGSRPGLELIHPAVAVFAGGVISWAALSLFVLPVLYLQFGLGPAAERQPELTGVLDELARTGAAGAPAGTLGAAMTESGPSTEPSVG